MSSSMEPMPEDPQIPTSADVALLRSALLEGDPSESSFRPSLPSGVGDTIMEAACYWACMGFMNKEPVNGADDADMLYLETGPLHVAVKMLKISIDSHDQGWSSYPEVCAVGSSLTSTVLGIMYWDVGLVGL